ncbi:MAG: RNA ligase family protein [Candidatus Pacearchaeota archaeon]|jgi:tRNA-binding EMAP/Myf-like protein
MLSISKDANLNYLAKVVQIKELKKHPDADKLQIAIIDFQEVIVGMDTKVGDICIFFPLESQINAKFLAHTNSFRHSNLNEIQNDEKCGFFEDNGRVRAVRLRGQKSMGVLFPFSTFEEFIGYDIPIELDKEFDMIDKTVILKKYFVPTRNSGLTNRQLGKKPRISRLVEGQVHLHVDTESLLKNMDRINPDDYISITYKVHGTSFWVSNVLVKRKLKLYEKLLKGLGIKINCQEYDFVYGSRKVVKNEFETSHKEHYYEYDLWGEIKDELKDKIPQGYTLYGECLGYTKGGGYIQKPYDYGCKQHEKKLMIYRITLTNESGLVYNLSTLEIKEFCDRYNLEYVPLFYYGKASGLGHFDIKHHWKEEFVQHLQKEYTEKDCFICKNKVPEEGIVLRKESGFQFETYKLKSFKFLEYETKLLDEGTVDMESSN